MHRVRHQPLFWLTILVASAAAGLLYDRLFSLGRPFVGATYGVRIVDAAPPPTPLVVERIVHG